jgi:hypothetical protein
MHSQQNIKFSRRTLLGVLQTFLETVVVGTAVVSFRVGFENCTLLGYYAVSSGNSLLTFWDILTAEA